jgi:uncharacterized iron-regulated membrane protein
VYDEHMFLVKLSIWSRKIHRYLVILISVIGLVMMVTGFKMHKVLEGEDIFPFFDYAATRTLHNQLSTVFAITLGAMMVTGIYMYIYPWLIQLSRRKTVTPPTPPSQT